MSTDRSTFLQIPQRLSHEMLVASSFFEFKPASPISLLWVLVPSSRSTRSWFACHRRGYFRDTQILVPFALPWLTCICDLLSHSFADPADPCDALPLEPCRTRVSVLPSFLIPSAFLVESLVLACFSQILDKCRCSELFRGPINQARGSRRDRECSHLSSHFSLPSCSLKPRLPPT